MLSLLENSIKPTGSKGRGIWIHLNLKHQEESARGFPPQPPQSTRDWSLWEAYFWRYSRRQTIVKIEPHSIQTASPSRHLCFFLGWDLKCGSSLLRSPPGLSQELRFQPSIVCLLQGKTSIVHRGIAPSCSMQQGKSPIMEHATEKSPIMQQGKSPVVSLAAERRLCSLLQLAGVNPLGQRTFLGVFKKDLESKIHLSVEKVSPNPFTFKRKAIFPRTMEIAGRTLSRTAFSLDKTQINFMRIFPICNTENDILLKQCCHKIS